MNRALMDRQMFKMGGVAKSDFPDLSGDGKVTQKDILMGRGVISKQEGGMIPADPMMMPEEQPMMMPPEAGAEAAVPAALEQVFGQMQMQMDAKMKEMDAQFEMQKMQMEYQMKNQFEEAAHVRRLKEIQVGNIGKVAANKAQGESREKTVEKSAHFQSKMIEQRKGKEGPIGDPDLELGM